MFTNVILASFAAMLCSSIGLVDARTVRRDVVSPPITYPTTGTVWQVNDRHNVTWDTSVIPPGFTSTGMIVLGFLTAADGDNEHLDLDHPLAKGFPITSGRAEITVPSVSTGNSYILVLFGDSGNASGKFTIKNISITPSPSSTTVASTPASSAAPSSASTTITDSDPAPTESGKTTPTEAAPSSSQKGSASAPAPQASSTAPASVAAATSSGFSTTQASPAAQSAGSTTKQANAGARIVTFATTWPVTVCSLSVILGFVL